MRDALVVMEDRDGCAALLREAAAYAAGAGTELVLYSALTGEQYEEAIETLDEIGRIENRDYSDEEALGVARQFAERMATETLDGDVAWSVVADVNEELEARHVIEAAESRNCDHVFTLGRRRSPTGKAVFGDETQRLILNFEGYVTVKVE
jgi:nucleotide-binding universal stress UspA family protein